MKKLSFILFLILVGLSVNAQLKVNTNGTAQIGVGKQITPPGQSTVSTLQTSSPTTSQIGPPSLNPDTLASLSIFNPRTTYGVGAYIAFGGGRRLSIGESSNGILNLFSGNGIEFLLGDTKIFGYKLADSAFTFSVDLKATSFLTDSDSRLKSDVSEIDGVGVSLNSITPVSYKLTSTPEALTRTVEARNVVSTAEVPMEDNLVESVNPSDRTRYGFIAQEVKEIFPELVVEDENGYLSIDYLGFIPILVDAYRNHERQIKKQEELISQLLSETRNRTPVAGIDNVGVEGKAYLLQNCPNPFRDTTVIGCTVPKGSADAFICIYDLQGKQVLHVDIEERGNCSVQIDGNSLQPGMYIYALIIDGFEIDSRKMILTD